MSISTRFIFSLFLVSLRKTSKRSIAIRFTAILLGFLFFPLASVFADTTFTADINGTQATPVTSSTAAGIGTVILNAAETQVVVTLYIAGLSSTQTAANIHGPAPRGTTAAALINLPNGNFSQNFAVTPAQAADLKAGLWYFNVRSNAFPTGEIRGQIDTPSLIGGLPFPLSNGSLDMTFDGDGILNTEIGGGNNVAQAVAVQPDGKIVAAGFALIGSNTDFTLTRYTPNGTLDTTFDSDGIVTTAIGVSNEEIFAVAIQLDGKIVVVGRTSSGVTTDIAVVRYNSNGTLDNSFDGDSGTGNGIVTTPIGSGNEIARAVAIQPDGKIVVAGQNFNGANDDIAIVRYNGNGTLDSTFDGNSGMGNGIVTTAVGGGNDFGYSVAVQSDGKIVVAGYYFNGTNNDVALARYNANGVLDTTFDGDGIVTTGVNITDEAFAVALQTDGKIVIAGCTNNGGGNDFLLIRYNQNGSLDSTFDADGVTVTPIGNAVDIAFGVAIQPDGKIIAAGFSNNGSNNDFALIRRNSDGSLDASFDADGKLTTPIGISTDNANGVALQADGKIVVVGRTVIGSTADFGVVRYGFGGDETFALNATTAIRFDNAFMAGTTAATPISLLGLPPLPAGFYKVAGTAVQDIRTSAAFTGEVLVKSTLPTSVDMTTFNSVQILHLESGAWIDRTTAAPPRDFATRTIYARVTSLSPFVVVSPFEPPATSVTIGGRVLTAQGRGVYNAGLWMTDQNGAIRHARTNPFGFYRFPNVSTGQTVVINVQGKRFVFAPKIIITEETIALNFVAEP